MGGAAVDEKETAQGRRVQKRQPAEVEMTGDPEVSL
jgi:hypothetical protein